MLWNRKPDHPKEDDLSALLDGELTGRAREGVAAHVETCARCRALLDELGIAKAVLAALPRETPQRSFTISPERVPRPIARRASPFAYAPAVALTLLVALIAVDVGGLSSSSSSNERASGGLATTAEKAAQDQAASSAGAAPVAPTIVPPSTGPGGAGAIAPTPVPNTAGPAPNTGEGPTSAVQPTPRAPTTGPGQGGVVSTVTTFGGTEAARNEDNAAPTPTVAAPAKTSTDEDEGGGVSALRVLEIVAAVVFVGSVAGVYVWPRLRRS